MPLFRLLRAMAVGFLLTLSLAACAAQSGSKLEFVGRLDWPPSAHHLGGFSGLELSADGSRFTAISDRGGLITGRLIRQGPKLVAVDQTAPQPLYNTNGAPLRGAKVDAEGLAIGPDGRLYISFEGHHRVWSYDGAQKPRPLDRPRAFTALQGNSGFEALAIAADGRLYTLPERSGQLTRPFPVWRHDDGRWSIAFDLPRRGGFLPVGADFGPDGRFYLLERAFNGISFQSRLRRFAFGENRILSEETLLETAPHRHGNLEGLSVWRDATGALRLTMLSDDNFRGFQRSEFVEYRLTE